MYAEISETDLTQINNTFFLDVEPDFKPSEGEAVIFEVLDSRQSHPLPIEKMGACHILCSCGSKTYNLGVSRIFCYSCHRLAYTPDESLGDRIMPGDKPNSLRVYLFKDWAYRPIK